MEEERVLDSVQFTGYAPRLRITVQYSLRSSSPPLPYSTVCTSEHQVMERWDIYPFLGGGIYPFLGGMYPFLGGYIPILGGVCTHSWGRGGVQHHERSRRFKIYSVSFSHTKYLQKKDINFHTKYLISSCNKNLSLEANFFSFFDRKELNLFRKLSFSNPMLCNPMS